VSCPVHEAVSKNTELDLKSWVMRRVPLYRLTCRHAMEQPNHTPNVAHTKNGRWYISRGVGARDEAKLVPFLDRYAMRGDLEPPGSDADLRARNVPGSSGSNERQAHVLEVIQRFVRAFRYDTMPWREVTSGPITGRCAGPLRFSVPSPPWKRIRRWPPSSAASSGATRMSPSRG
jgi:hypothetical protein